jgi:hypothetical protein
VPAFKIIPASEAPAIPTRQSQYAIELMDRVRSLEEGQVLRVTPDVGRSPRGLRSGIGRILKAADLAAITWDDGTHAYIAKAQAKANGR